MLNQYCKKKGITTFFIQHGIFERLKVYLEDIKKEKQMLKHNPNILKEQQQNNKIDKKSAIKFVLQSLNFGTLAAFLTACIAVGNRNPGAVPLFYVFLSVAILAVVFSLFFLYIHFSLLFS